MTTTPISRSSGVSTARRKASGFRMKRSTETLARCTDCSRFATLVDEAVIICASTLQPEAVHTNRAADALLPIQRVAARDNMQHFAVMWNSQSPAPTPSPYQYHQYSRRAVRQYPPHHGCSMRQYGCPPRSRTPAQYQTRCSFPPYVPRREMAAVKDPMSLTTPFFIPALGSMPTPTQKYHPCVLLLRWYKSSVFQRRVLPLSRA